MAQSLMVVAVIYMMRSVDQTECSKPINHWTVTMWILIAAKFATVGTRLNNHLMTIYLGHYLANPVTFTWTIVGLNYVRGAEGKGCFEKVNSSIVVLQIVLGFASTIAFSVGTLFLLMALLRPVLYHAMRLCFTRERLDQMRIFRFRLAGRVPEEFQIPSLDIEALKTKIKKTIHDEHLEGSLFKDNTCPICYEEYQKGQHYIQLKCDHVFHSECLEVWLKNHQTCPMCKGEVKMSDYEHLPNQMLEEDVNSQIELTQSTRIEMDIRDIESEDHGNRLDSSMHPLTTDV